MKKALLVTHVSGFVPQFEMGNVKILQDMGYEVHYASNYRNPSYGDDNRRLDGTGIIRHQVDFERSPYSLKNVTAYRQLKQVMEEERFELVHCHNPMSGVITRLAAHATNTRPVIYTAHGFHFYKGAPLKNWLFYYPVEYLLSFYTDQQICINLEDFKRAKRYFHAGMVNYVPGVGIDIKKIRKVQIDAGKKRKDLGLPEQAIVLVSAGELITRKNHEIVIRALKTMKDRRFVYVICGHGELDTYLKGVTRDLQVEDQVFFLGYRTDILEIYKASDICVFPSFQEGLPVALMEAMAVGLPVICSDIRGNTDLIDSNGGILVNPIDEEAYTNAIVKLGEDKHLRKMMGEYNWKKAEKFDAEKVRDVMLEIYGEVLKRNGR
ncbi:MAG TPA: glycosyltransferase family 4 protein [Candidatus Lachnoclostridium pullistercoris]|uniref:Glycosyltransferase family 4 protein n=1 Tax=Candidatus Lachnoclostridium pullistercoris TaxID=2838632 RepID=A0A9D2PEK6_9FIRM|nr:glycosyltransferase family 4 protein [Candidatus Lachnoclostridium pullistercoris]